MKAHGIVLLLEEYAPLNLMASWDNSGWQVGSREEEVAGVWVTLDVTSEVVAEAEAHGANLLIAHHPLIFEPLRSLDTESYKGRLIQTLLLGGIGLYVAHTNLDVVAGGVNTALAEALHLSNLRPLQPLAPTSTDKGWPGWGAVGTPATALTTEELASQARHHLGTAEVRVTRSDSGPHQTIAVCGGSGAALIAEARRAGATAYLTGEIKYHEAQDAARVGLTVLEVGHFYSERPVLERLAGHIRIRTGLPTGVSSLITSPFDPW
jgi:dinuclear metal center YbgI/SA1388 family protein